MSGGDMDVSLSGWKTLKKGIEKAEITILCNGRDMRTFSDGEKRLIDLIIGECLRLVNGNNLSLLVFDESLSLLDRGRFKSVIDYYTSVIGDGNIIVVSQDTSLSDLFAYSIKVTKSEGIADVSLS
jgi:DNA repair exonuclease SbcCD ATPase subunit